MFEYGGVDVGCIDIGFGQQVFVVGVVLVVVGQVQVQDWMQYVFGIEQFIDIGIGIIGYDVVFDCDQVFVLGGYGQNQFVIQWFDEVYVDYVQVQFVVDLFGGGYGVVEGKQGDVVVLQVQFVFVDWQG